MKKLKNSGTEEELTEKHKILANIVEVMSSVEELKESQRKTEEGDREIGKQILRDALKSLKDKRQAVSPFEATTDDDFSVCSTKPKRVKGADQQLAESLLLQEKRRADEIDVERLRLQVEEKKLELERERLRIEDEKARRESERERERLQMDRIRMEAEMKEREELRKLHTEMSEMCRAQLDFFASFASKFAK